MVIKRSDPWVRCKSQKIVAGDPYAHRRPQLRHFFSVGQGRIVWFDLEYLKGICPVKGLTFRNRAVIVNDDQVRREVPLVYDSYPKRLRIIYEIALGPP